MEKLDFEEYNMECPSCGSIMRGMLGTKAEMTENPEDDNITEIMWWECIDCDYMIEAEKYSNFPQ